MVVGVAAGADDRAGALAGGVGHEPGQARSPGALGETASPATRVLLWTVAGSPDVQARCAAGAALDWTPMTRHPGARTPRTRQAPAAPEPEPTGA